VTEPTEHTTEHPTATTSDEAPPDETTTSTSTEQDGDHPRPSHREAKYRRALRETEAERDQLRERVEAMQRAEAERLASDQLARPAALWATGITLAELLDDNGAVSPDKVNAAAQHAADQLGVAPPSRPPRPDPTQGGRGATVEPADPWAEAFAPPR
jgi:hypothetical protein